VICSFSLADWPFTLPNYWVHIISDHIWGWCCFFHNVEQCYTL